MSEQKKTNVKLKIIFIYAISIALACTVFYLIIPYLLNYSPDTINTEFDKQMSGGLYYYQQILLASIAIVFVISSFLFFILKDIDYYPIYIKDRKKYRKQIEYIKKIALSLPSKLLLIFISIPLLLCVCVLLLQTSYLTSSDFKLMLLIFILSTTTISIANTFSSRILSKILIALENTSFSNIKQNSLITKLLLKIIPIMAVCIVLTYLAVSSIYERNNASFLANYYNNQFESISQNISLNTRKDLSYLLDSVSKNSDNDTLFIADTSFNFIYQSNELSTFFKKYAQELSYKNNYRVYDYYGTSGQGILYPIKLQNGEQYYIGASYVIQSDETIYFIVALLGGLGIVCGIILYGFISELTNNIKEVNKSLENISKDNNNFSGKKLYITSVDEIGELIQNYNKIQALTTNHLRQIHNNQETLMERERLASLGQLIGGIAHNLKTPIMSISGAAEGLNDLIKEYDSSIDDPQVNSSDHHEIAGEMSDWIIKIKTHTEYMSDVITAVKGQAVTLANEEDITFTVDELIKRVNILMKHELKNAIAYLNVKMLADEETVIHGDINSLVQVINNMISNAIQSYNGKPEQTIDLIVDKDKQHNLIISIKDYGCGIPESVKKKLFREMITTKGKNGTGLGLYMSYSTIKAHFKGNITINSEEGKGTTFNIILPI